MSGKKSKHASLLCHLKTFSTAGIKNERRRLKVAVHLESLGSKLVKISVGTVGFLERETRF